MRHQGRETGVAAISLLRAINVGGNRLIKMDALRALYESLGLAPARTHLQSGNVVFRAPARELPRLPARLSKAIEQTFGFHVDVIVRTAGEMRDVIRRNPFAGRNAVEPNRLLVYCLSADPTPEARAKALALPPTPEELRLDGRQLYIYYPNGVGKATLQLAALERALAVQGTGRNWNTITRLVEIAEALNEDPASR